MNAHIFQEANKGGHRAIEIMEAWANDNALGYSQSDFDRAEEKLKKDALRFTSAVYGHLAELSSTDLSAFLVDIPRPNQ